MGFVDRLGILWCIYIYNGAKINLPLSLAWLSHMISHPLRRTFTNALTQVAIMLHHLKSSEPQCTAHYTIDDYCKVAVATCF